MDTYRFVFAQPDQTSRFVARCAHYLIDVAILRHSELEVEVLDGGEPPQRERIYQFARTSGDAFPIPVPRPT